MTSFDSTYNYDGAYKTSTDYFENNIMNTLWIHYIWVIVGILFTMVAGQISVWVMTDVAKWTPYLSQTGEGY